MVRIIHIGGLQPSLHSYLYDRSIDGIDYSSCSSDIEEEETVPSFLDQPSNESITINIKTGEIVEEEQSQSVFLGKRILLKGEGGPHET